MFDDSLHQILSTFTQITRIKELCKSPIQNTSSNSSTVPSSSNSASDSSYAPSNAMQQPSVKSSLFTIESDLLSRVVLDLGLQPPADGPFGEGLYFRVDTATTFETKLKTELRGSCLIAEGGHFEHLLSLARLPSSSTAPVVACGLRFFLGSLLDLMLDCSQRRTTPTPSILSRPLLDAVVLSRDTPSGLAPEVSWALAALRSVGIRASTDLTQLQGVKRGQTSIDQISLSCVSAMIPYLIVIGKEYDDVATAKVMLRYKFILAS